jgi:hypothetical protein
MNYKRGPSYLLALALVMAACERSEEVASLEPEITITAPASTSADAPTAVPDRAKKFAGPRHQCFAYWDI